MNRYSIASSVPRTPYNEPRSPPVYTNAMNIGSVPRTPYNEPRTPYNEPQVTRHLEPRSPSQEPAWIEMHLVCHWTKCIRMSIFCPMPGSLDVA